MDEKNTTLLRKNKCTRYEIGLWCQSVNKEDVEHCTSIMNQFRPVAQFKFHLDRVTFDQTILHQMVKEWEPNNGRILHFSSCVGIPVETYSVLYQANMVYYFDESNLTLSNRMLRIYSGKIGQRSLDILDHLLVSSASLDIHLMLDNDLPSIQRIFALFRKHQIKKLTLHGNVVEASWDALFIEMRDLECLTISKDGCWKDDDSRKYFLHHVGTRLIHLKHVTGLKWFHGH